MGGPSSDTKKSIFIPRRIAVRAAQILTGVALLYMVTLNVLLETSLLRRIANMGRSFELDYTRAYSLVPGKVHVEGLTLKGADSHVEWFVAVDSVTFGTDIVALMHRQFHANHVRATGVSVRVRLLESAPDVEHDAHVPPIPGFAVPALKPIGPPEAVSDASYDLVTVDLEDVEALHVRQIWVDTMNVHGDLDVRGRWVFHPVRLLAVGPASVDIRRLDVAYGADDPYVADARGYLATTIEPYNLRLPPADLVRNLSIRADLAGTLRAQALPPMLPLPASVVLTDGVGTLSVRGELLRGVIAPASTCVLNIAALAAHGFRKSATSALALRSHVALEGREPVGVVEIDLKGVDVSGASVVEAHADALGGSLRFAGVDLAAGPNDIGFTVSVSGLNAPSLVPWAALIPFDVSIAGKLTGAAGHAEGSLTEGTLSGAVEVDVAGLSGTRGAARARADAHTVLTGSVANRHSSGSLEMVLSRARVVVSDKEVAAGASLKATSWDLDWPSTGIVVHTGPVDVTLRDIEAWGRAASPASAIGLVRAASLSTRSLTFADGRVSGTLAFDVPRVELLSAAQLARCAPMPSWLRVTGGGGTASARGTFDFGRSMLSGRGRVELRRLDLRSGTRRLLGDGVLAIIARGRPEADSVDLTGTTLSIDHLAGAGDDDWWARAEILDGGIRSLGRGAQARADVQLRARDARPVDAVVSSISGVPKWVLGIFALPNLTARSEIRLAANSMEVRGLKASGGSSLVQLELVKAPSEMRGVVFASHGDLSIGLGLGAETPHVVLLDAEKWFMTRQADLQHRSPMAGGAPGALPDRTAAGHVATFLQSASP